MTLLFSLLFPGFDCRSLWDAGFEGLICSVTEQLLRASDLICVVLINSRDTSAALKGRIQSWHIFLVKSEQLRLDLKLNVFPVHFDTGFDLDD